MSKIEPIWGDQYIANSVGANLIYKSPVLADKEITIYSVHNAFYSLVDGWTMGTKMDTITITDMEGSQVFSSPDDFSYTPIGSTFTIEYKMAYNRYQSDDVYTGTATYIFLVVANLDPLPKWNAWTVIERALIISEPLRKGETPRFHLNAEQAAEFEKIETPEFHFTNSTLREILQGVGAYVHGEPRLCGNEIRYDMYGSGEENNVYLANYSAKSFQQTVDSFVTNIDSSVDNFVNTLGYAKGVIMEPYSGGYKTVRTEKTFARIEENNLFISTTFPIRRVSKLYFGCFAQPIDITPYVFEVSEYARLSSYEGLYPKSRAYAIYYTQGERNIQGLMFKQADPINSVFKNYAILNILRAVTGKSKLDISDDAYSRLAFYIEYEPIYPTRVQQNKSYYLDIKYPRTIVYNQGQNLIETKYYGENLKGVIARLGNVDKVITIVQRGAPQIPKVGTLYDDDYYISAVAVELGAKYAKITCALSKDFNRYSDYVGVNSTKRFYEISERQAYDSVISYRDFVVIGDDVTGNSPVLFNMSEIADEFTQAQSYEAVSVVFAQGEDDAGNLLNDVVLPVMGSALGNAAVLMFKYQDNYSAGDNATFRSAGEVSGYFQNAVPYCDNYGNMEYLHASYYSAASKPAVLTQDTIGLALPDKISDIKPQGDVRVSTGDKPLWVKKGSTEILSVSYQIEYVTNRRKLIVGSALAQNNTFISGTQIGHEAVLYVLPYKLNKFDMRVNTAGGTLIHNYANGGISVNENTAVFAPQTSTVAGQAWVMIDKATGDVLIGENTEITGDGTTDILHGLTMTGVHDLFKIKKS